MKINKELHLGFEIFAYICLSLVLTAANFLVLPWICTIGLFYCEAFPFWLIILLGPIFIEAFLLGFLKKRKIPAILGSSPILAATLYFIYLVLDQKNYPSLEFDNFKSVQVLLVFFLATTIVGFLGALAGIKVRRIRN